MHFKQRCGNMYGTKHWRDLWNTTYHSGHPCPKKITSTGTDAEKNLLDKGENSLACSSLQNEGSENA